MNRAQRRAGATGAPAYGILDALKKEYKRGYEDGFNGASPRVIKTVYASIALTMSELYGFERERITDVLRAVDGHVLNTLASDEIIEEVWEKIGLTLDFNDPLDPIKERTEER